MRFDLRVNGTVRTIDTPPLRRLLDILREDLDLTGTKEGCGEGECGACAVLLDGRLVNACLVPALQLPGREVVTIEGLGTAEHPDPVQRAFMDEGAAQCGFCIPGMVMASRALLDAEPRPTRDAVRHGLAGNLCRCTGYERILRAVERAAAISPAPTDARGARRRATGSPPVAQRAIATAQGCRADGPRLLTPTTLDEAVNALPGLGPDRLLVAGATDLMVELHAARRAPSAIMDLTRIRELARIRVTDTSIRIGAATTFAELAAEPAVARELPAVAAMARQIGAVAIQNRATLGGNLVTASPAADSAPILMALGARLDLARRQGERVMPLDAFYTGYRRTALAPDELLVAIEVPRPAAGTVQRFFKVGTRRAQAISKVCLGAAARLDAGRRVTHLRLAAGSVAATPILLDTVAAPLIGRCLDGETDHAALATLVLRATRAAVSPIDDVRSTADYRRETLGRLVVGFIVGLAGGTGTGVTG